MPITIRYATTDADIVVVHRFLCVVAAPVLLAPIDPIKSITEISRLVKQPGAGFVLMAIQDDRLVGAMGVTVVGWWYSEESFMTNRFFFITEDCKHTGVAADLEREAVAVANELQLKLVINGKMRRKGDVFLATHKDITNVPR